MADARAPGKNRILDKMLDRLFAALVNGPSLNCRPHSSRQRVDWTLLAKLKDGAPEEALRRLLGKDEEVRLVGHVPMPRRVSEEQADEELSAEERAARQAWSEQLSLLGKLRGIAEDAKTYEQDTGVHVLNVGFPLLSLPPGVVGAKGRGGGATRRIVAPIAFVPVSVVVKSGATAGVVISCKGEGVDRVTPNTALLAWLEQQTGKRIEGELFADEEGSDPWREISELVRHVCGVMEMAVPGEFVEQKREEKAEVSIPLPSSDLGPAPEVSSPVSEAVERVGFGAIVLQPAPRADEAGDAPKIHLSAVMGLFPMANQGLLRDMQAMAGGEALAGPVTSFVQANVSLDAPPEAVMDAPQPQQPVVRRTRRFAEERLVAQADPCQSRAVKLARQARGLVIHGPPGTGKSQTITNIIGDHLSRGERVLLVSDKRTALDVVANRLEHMGLGRLVALIHDPQRDQRDLYRAIREQLEVLAEATTDERAERQLGKVDEELQGLHSELMEYWDALMSDPDGQAESFHALVGRWLAIADSAEAARVEKVASTVSLSDLETHAHLIDETFGRVAKVEWWANPWREAAGIDLARYMGMPMDAWRDAMSDCVAAARRADVMNAPTIPPFVDNVSLQDQDWARTKLTNTLEWVNKSLPLELRRRWGEQDERSQARAVMQLSELSGDLAAVRGAPLDRELAVVARERLPGMAQLALQLGSIRSYLEIAGKWYEFFCIRRKSEAGRVLRAYGLTLSPENAARLETFLVGLRSRLMLQAAHDELYDVPNSGGLLTDELLDSTLSALQGLLALLQNVREMPALAPLLGDVLTALVDDERAVELIRGLRASSPRATAVQVLTTKLALSGLFSQGYCRRMDCELRRNRQAVETVSALAERVQDVESILRIRAALAKLPDGVRRAIETLSDRPVEAEVAVGAIRKAALAAEITRRLASDPRLQNVDGQRVSGAFDRYRKLEEKKRGLVRDVILHQWTSRQKERLLASTGSRLGALGAELKRRLTMRGERAMRLRQVLAAGQKTDGGEGGDPLFDVCPVWMASPETVAQLFERKEVFSVVIFDEASQCRLEETLPVLTRGRRVVIAGDPKQLPPTRFFESAVAQSEDEEIETDQQLFEAQQGEIEDLLGAALNLEIEQAYLDVHYRSRSAELIEFSNEHFYGSRLQAIPGRPSNKPPGAPLILHRADGVYDKRQNEAEATKVVEIVRELLGRKEPPSIGIACFNLQQRDLIVEQLDEAAVEDERLGRRLAEARTRQGKGSFEGLFVKNLENVQGDERDHMIISTTYGPDAGGRFYRRFGPLGRAGGGRRLNVLVTRAREAVHLVTSIPADAYRALPPVPAGQAPTGGWLLFAYLKYAEQVGTMYAEADAGESVDSENGDGRHAPDVRKLPTKTPSVFAESLAHKLSTEHQIASDVYWGNDGFLVDVALRDPQKPDDVTLGLLVDATRFAGAEDPVEWDVFRTGIHKAQGWTLQRIWSPHFFRDPNGVTESIVRGTRT